MLAEGILTVLCMRLQASHGADSKGIGSGNTGSPAADQQDRSRWEEQRERKAIDKREQDRDRVGKEEEQIRKQENDEFENSQSEQMRDLNKQVGNRCAPFVFACECKDIIL